MTWVFLMLMTLVLPWTIQKDVLGAEAEQGSITVRLDDLGTPMDNVKFTAYRVGKWSGEGNGCWKKAWKAREYHLTT